MMRDQLRDKAYYDKRIEIAESARLEALQGLRGYNDDGKTGCAADLCRYSNEIIFMRYSRGDAIEAMRDSVQKSYEILQLRRKVLDSVQIEERIRKMWENLDLGSLSRYLTTLAFMVALRFPAADILNALKVIGHVDEEDALLALAATYFGKEVPDVQNSKYPKAYGELVAMSRADAKEQPALLKKYVNRWYRLNRPVYWHDTHKGAEGAYVGYWCFDVALVVMLLGIDDSQAQDHPHYSSDLVRHYRQQVQSA
ncbi:MAG: DUF1911 domain-containing protein [Zoogloeaceae bacterium]|jgi:hypothetical protein|nr:DUF1911 domain-containing protein [Zoogloeaceae bacterium]